MAFIFVFSVACARRFFFFGGSHVLFVSLLGLWQQRRSDKNKQTSKQTSKRIRSSGLVVLYDEWKNKPGSQQAILHSRRGPPRCSLPRPGARSPTSYDFCFISSGTCRVGERVFLGLESVHNECCTSKTLRRRASGAALSGHGRMHHPRSCLCAGCRCRRVRTQRSSNNDRMNSLAGWLAGAGVCVLTYWQ